MALELIQRNQFRTHHPFISDNLTPRSGVLMMGAHKLSDGLDRESEDIVMEGI